jgi:hypothetical protein
MEGKGLRGRRPSEPGRKGEPLQRTDDIYAEKAGILRVGGHEARGSIRPGGRDADETGRAMRGGLEMAGEVVVERGSGRQHQRVQADSQRNRAGVRHVTRTRCARHRPSIIRPQLTRQLLGIEPGSQTRSLNLGRQQVDFECGQPPLAKSRVEEPIARTTASSDERQCSIGSCRNVPRASKNCSIV